MTISSIQLNIDFDVKELFNLMMESAGGDRASNFYSAMNRLYYSKNVCTEKGTGDELRVDGDGVVIDGIVQMVEDFISKNSDDNEPSIMVPLTKDIHELVTNGDEDIPFVEGDNVVVYRCGHKTNIIYTSAIKEKYTTVVRHKFNRIFNTKCRVLHISE